ncbi:hypothetical protein CEE97_10940, partial [Lactobacillus crispatus]
IIIRRNEAAVDVLAVSIDLAIDDTGDVALYGVDMRRTTVAQHALIFHRVRPEDKGVSTGLIAINTRKIVDHTRAAPIIGGDDLQRAHRDVGVGIISQDHPARPKWCRQCRRRCRQRPDDAARIKD